MVEVPTGIATTVETEEDTIAAVAMGEVEAMAAVAVGATEAGTLSSEFYLQLLCMSGERGVVHTTPSLVSLPVDSMTTGLLRKDGTCPNCPSLIKISTGNTLTSAVGQR